MNDNKIEKPIEQALQAQASIGSSYHKHGSYFSKGRGGENHGGAWYRDCLLYTSDAADE